MIDQPGKYVLSMVEYQADPCPVPSLSRGIIQELIYHSPAHAWFKHPRLNPNFKEEVDSKFDLGTAAHSLLLSTPWSIAVIEADDWRKKEAKEARDLARKEGKTPLLKRQYEEAKAMVFVANDAILNCKELGITDLLEDGDSELSYLWSEEDTWFRIRPDWISKDRKLILDYKTTGNSANPSDIARHIVSMAYDIQSALYLRGIKHIENIDAKFVFLFQEDTPQRGSTR